MALTRTGNSIPVASVAAAAPTFLLLLARAPVTQLSLVSDRCRSGKMAAAPLPSTLSSPAPALLPLRRIPICWSHPQHKALALVLAALFLSRSHRLPERALPIRHSLWSSAILVAHSRFTSP